MFIIFRFKGRLNKYPVSNCQIEESNDFPPKVATRCVCIIMNETHTFHVIHYYTNKSLPLGVTTTHDEPESDSNPGTLISTKCVPTFAHWNELFKQYIFHHFI